MTGKDPIKPGLYDPQDFVPRAPPAPHLPARVEESKLPDDAPPALPTNRWRRRFLWFAAAALLAISAVQLVDVVRAAASLHPALGWAVGGLLIAALGAALMWCRDELGEFRRMARVEALQAQSQTLLEAGRTGTAAPWLGAVERQLADVAGTGTGLARFQAMNSGSYSDADTLALFEREVLLDADRRAQAAIARAVRMTALGTAASPLAMLDGAIVLYRALRLVREVATIYGFRPGGLAAVALLRRVLFEASAAAAADIASTLVADAIGGLGHKLAGSVSARLGVGVFTGLRMARLGFATMRACRPMPFVAESPQLNEVVRRALGIATDADDAPR
jgi:putative membrane protein